MLLERVDSPQDLKRLTLAELPLYCKEVREFIVSACSKRPGHLASSLGAVELVVALHYVYDTPADKIVWDVGHQAYAHKMITGRRSAFGTLRMLGGIGGFPRPGESEYDAFTAGHASNSISAALGMATAARLTGGSEHVVAVIGDGAMTGGLAFEGLNNAGVSKSDLLVILNDNRISIDKSAGALKEYLIGITTSERYNRLKTRVWTMFPPGSRVHDFLKKTSNAIKHGVLQQSNLFESFGFRYFGPVDGHDVVSLVKVLRDLRRIGGPKLLHTITVKGHGYAPAELDQTTWHSPGQFDPHTGQRKNRNNERGRAGVPNKSEELSEYTTHIFPQNPLRAYGASSSDLDGTPIKARAIAVKAVASSGASRWQDVFGETLTELARADEKIVAITPAMVSGSGLGTMMEEMPTRTFDVGIAEGHAVTFAAGVAAGGGTPFVVVYSSFLQRAYDNIIHDVAIEGLGVVICIDRGGLVGEDGATHQGVFDVAALLPIPGLVIASPRDEVELRNLLYTASTAGVPFVIRYPRGTAPGSDWRGKKFEKIEIGTGREITKERELCTQEEVEMLQFAAEPSVEARREKSETDASETAVLTFGPIEVPEGVAHYDLRFAKPLDEKLLHEVGARFRKVITVEDGAIRGGVGAAVEEFFARHNYPIRVTKLGVPDRFIEHGSVDELRALCGFDVATIQSQIERRAGAGVDAGTGDDAGADW